jgi:ABC-type phosphate transport system auxiliary subunit
VITDEEIEKCLDWLTRSAVPAAKARAEREYIEQYRKSLKAILEGKSDAKTVAEREAFAYSHKEYRDHLEALRIAIEADEKFRWLQVAAECKIELFRTQAANSRAQGKIA